MKEKIVKTCGGEIQPTRSGTNSLLQGIFSKQTISSFIDANWIGNT